MRLIDAEALENEIAKTMRYVPKDAVLDVACMVNRAPTIEAKPVVHAHWENEHLNRYGHLCHCCSNCGFSASHKDENWCANCGALMDEVTE